MKWSIERTTTVGFALGLAMVEVIELVSYRTGQEFVGTNRWATHTVEILGEFEATFSDVSLGDTSYIVKPVDHDPFMAVVKEIELYWLVRNQSPN